MQPRILYMEDDSGAARLFQKKLQRVGYQVDLACNGEEGLMIYQQGHYDLLAVDQKMPVYDGLDVIRYLAERNCLPPTIMITGAGDEKIAVEAMKLGAGDYIVKDVDGGYLELVPTVIEQLLHHQQLVLERKQALEAVEQRNRNLALLNQIGQTLISILNKGDIFEQLLCAVLQLIPAESCSLWLLNDNQWMTCQAVLKRGQIQLGEALQLPPGAGLVNMVAQETAGSFINDLSTSNSGFADASVYGPLTVRSLLAVPLRARDRVIGVLEVANRTGGEFSADDQSLLETLASSGAMAIDNARLVETLHQNMLELQLQNEDLEAFSHTVAHDLKSPVGVMLGFAQLIQTERARILDEEARISLEFIQKSAHKLVNIVDELLLLAEVRKVDIQACSLNMGKIVADARQRLINVIGESEARMIIPESWPTAVGYGPWIEEVWFNYLSNALKYGGQPPVIKLGATVLDDGYVCFWVRDNGPGMTTEQQSRLFAPFTRLNQIRAEGHGLGLSIVRRIIEKLGGKVMVESAAGQGSIFGFTLPSTTM